ncbi:MAG: sulfatase family protein [Limisphaerales bacterium]
MKAPLKRLGAFVLSGLVSMAAAAADRPNIVLIISDDHAWTDYSFMGHPAIRTPHLDRLSRESLTFTRGYVPSSLCCPSLASIITGRYPHQHRVTSNDPPRPAEMTPAAFYRSPAFTEGRERMNHHLESVPTLPKLLGELGYLSLQTGKWWQGDFRRGGFTHGMTRGGRHGDDGLEIGRRTMQPIHDFIASARTEGQPFFVWYAPLLPHDPHTPPERLLERYRERTPSIHVARYWAMIEWFDETVGGLLEHLDQQGLTRDTIVVYLADNGWVQSTDHPRYAPRSKQSPYDGGLRTPIMLRWPGKVTPRSSSELASSIDLVPTLLGALGRKPEVDLPGIDLFDAKAVKARRAIFGECYTHDAVDLDRPAENLRWRWMIRGDWKLIVPDARNEPGGAIELYHLGRDPHEARNLASPAARRADRMRIELDRWWDPTAGSR